MVPMLSQDIYASRSTDAADGSNVFRDIELVGFRYRTKLHTVRPVLRIALFSTPHGRRDSQRLFMKRLRDCDRDDVATWPKY